MNDVKNRSIHVSSGDGIVRIVRIWWGRGDVCADLESSQGQLELLDLFITLRVMRG